MALVNWLGSLLSTPHPLPRMDFSAGIPPASRALVVVPTMLNSRRNVENLVEGRLTREEVPLRNAMNEVLRDAYVDDNQRGVNRWNKTIREEGIDFTLTLRWDDLPENARQYCSAISDLTGVPVGLIGTGPDRAP